MSNPDGHIGTQTASSRTSDYNAISFLVRELLATRNHVALVKIIAIDTSNPEDVRVDVQPMVNQVSGDGEPFEHGVINSIPVWRPQAGISAIILDPVVDDIGLCVFADRDISSVVVNRAVSNPGSMRQSDMADGLYLGGALNAIPTQFIRMDDDGIAIVSPTKVTLEAPEVAINAPTSCVITTGLFRVVGPAEFTEDVDISGTMTAPEAEINGIAHSTHKHGGVQSGPPTTKTLGPSS